MVTRYTVAMERDELLLLSDLNLAEALRESARSSGGSILEGEGYLLTAGPGAHPMLNGALRLDPSLDASAFMQRTRTFYGERGHGYSLTLREHVADSDLAKAAQEAGLSPTLELPAMVVQHRLEDVAPRAGTVLRRVVDSRGVSDFRNVAAEAWSTYGIPPPVIASVFSREELLLLPHAVAVVAYVDKTPLAAAMMFLSHGIAGIYWVSSVSHARGRGLGEACTRAVTNAGFDLGARAVVLQASPMGDAIYRRMGYAEISKYRLFWSLGPEGA